jgi:hypothetical protein
MSLPVFVNEALTGHMKRRLVLTNESARHPFRAMLPPPLVVDDRSDDNDWKLFALSFGAFFVCFSTFLL